MKRCPECRRDYFDDSLLYCLDDGTALLEGPKSEPGAVATAEFAESESATAILPEVHSTDEARTRTFDSGQPILVAVSKRNTIIAGAVGILIATALGIGAYFYFGRSDTQISSIAVLPFANESGNAEIEYLSDGMTETLISSLSQLPNLSVKARSSVFRYKGKDPSPKTVGADLNVEALVNGRLVQRGNDLTLHVELVDTQTENVLWKSDYNRTLSNLVSLQNEIARDVAGKLRAKLSGAEQTQIAKSYTENAEAYRLYLQGRFHWNKRKPEEHIRAVQYFEQAIALDPNYALAYSGIADCYAVSSSPLEGEERYNKLRTAANKALELDPTLGEPHAALASLAGDNWDWTYAERDYQKAIELNPDYPTAHQWYGEMLTRLGRHEEAIAEIQRARSLDPLSLVINSDMIYILVMARRYDEAIEQARRTLEMDPRWGFAGLQLVDAYLHKGLYEEALNEREKFLQNSDRTPEEKTASLEEVAILRAAYRSGGPAGFWRKLLESLTQARDKGEEIDLPFYASVHARLGNKDEAFKWLSKAVDEKESGIDLLKVDPAFDNLRSDPRMDELLRRMNLL
jgi:TolB-like protein/Tfp pilus assembly protein PilF